MIYNEIQITNIIHSIIVYKSRKIIDVITDIVCKERIQCVCTLSRVYVSLRYWLIVLIESRMYIKCCKTKKNKNELRKKIIYCLKYIRFFINHTHH